MLKNPLYHETPMLDTMNEVFRWVDVSALIPKLVRKAQGILRRDANNVRRQYGMEELEDK